MNIHHVASLNGDNPICLVRPFIAKSLTWKCRSVNGLISQTCAEVFDQTNVFV